MLVLASLLIIPFSGYTLRQAAASGATMVSNTALSGPVAGGNYLFWLDTRSRGKAIYGYDLNKQAGFLVNSDTADKPVLATDGNTLAWVETYAATLTAPPTDVIISYTISTGVQSTLITAPNADLGGLALDNGVLYYQDNTSGHSGLYAHTLATGAEQLISTTNQGGVTVNNGTILWTDKQYASQSNPNPIDPDTGRYLGHDVTTSTLHLTKLDGSIKDLVVASKPGCLSGYSVSGSSVVYAFGCATPDSRVYQYTIGGSTPSTPISAASGDYPLIGGGKIVWTSQPSGAPGTTNSWSVLTYDTASGTTVTTIGSSTATVVAYAISGNNNLAFTVTDDTSKGSMSIYLASLDQTGLSFSDSTPPPTTLNTCDRSHPITCGQVRQYGAYFVDDGGYWPMDGVQFILPQSGGINGNTFTSSVYNAAVSDGSLEFWLGVAQNYLLAKTLRVYLYEPSENSATCLSCISDFADRANNHGMRLGVVMRNGLSQMSQADANFVNSFINTFQNRSQEIAYVAADNETNNHGGSYCPDMKDRYNREYDCFDRYAISHTHDRTYINNAMTWMRDFTGLFVNHTPRSPILLTVSISTEMGDLDGYPIENDFFRYSSTPGLYRMADYVNFLSPHDYGGAASSILATLRQNPRCWQCYSYSGPVMLEEFGWPTDDVNEAANQQDGDQTTCRNNPYDQSCSNTAPYRVEVNASAVRGFHPPLGGYAASSAFMIADINQAPCSRHNGYSNNNFDGLFTANVAYCGGTYDPYNPHGGYYKNTAFRIRTHHYYFNPHP